MPWPLSQDYNEALQTPVQSFSDPDLQRAKVQCNALGIPLPRSGTFADVYELTAPDGKKWAVKCFTREVPGLGDHYAAISAHLRQVNLPFLVDFAYLEQGIRVQGQWYPILKMDWVEGCALNQFVQIHADNPTVLKLLAQVWMRLAQRLRESKIAHGDLQHGNVLLAQGDQARSLAVRLIDYDAMFVPALAEAHSGEVGHPAYQHPQRLRDGSYSSEVDRFSHLVIYTALRGLIVGGRSLWDRYDDGDNLLFRQADLTEPAQSALVVELQNLGDAEACNLVQTLIQSSQKPLSQTPLLEELIGGALPATAQVAATVLEAPGPDLGQAPAAVRHRLRRTTWCSATGVVVAGAGTLVALVVGGLLPAAKNLLRDAGPVGSLVAPAANSPTRAETSVLQSHQPDEPMRSSQLSGPLLVKPLRQLKLPVAGLESVAVSPNGRYALGADDQHIVHLWNVETGKEEQCFPPHSKPVVGLAFSPDGRLAVSGSEDRTLRLLNVASGEELQRFGGQTSNVWHPVFSQDGQRIVAGSTARSGDRSVAVWDVASGNDVKRFTAKTRRQVGTPRTSVFLPDGRQVLSGAADRSLRLWNVADGREVRRFDGHQGGVDSLAVSADGRWAVSASADRTVRLWDLATGKELKRFEGHAARVLSVALAPDGRHILSGSSDNTARLLEVASGKELHRFTVHTGAVLCVAFLDAGRRAVTGSIDGSLWLWQLGGIEPIATHPAPEAPQTRTVADGTK